ncbi:MAG: pyridoxal-dependent decarboxylase, exosortase A system-associated [Gallionella sp.]|nr:pyridoxal-dependent decarboxylase, exosortase A system-associated [Gallionella sp.]MDD4945578.1 pyridoxal-dependent decarboxylase, exosortase A system-associated [Gallionella sp.]MDD5612094.1 pyridoxal-dependent decarboxylase, exosortase A system-associated [Gallionella sp.]
MNLSHLPDTGFAVADNCLQIGGMPLTRLAERAGATPFYAYDRQLVSERVAKLRAALPAEIHLHYAIKANPMPALVQHLAGLVDGFDVASVGEMKTVLDSAMPAEKVSLAGPGKTAAQLRQAAAAGIVVNLESEREMELIAQAGAELGVRPKVTVRVNPDFELKSSGMKMSGGPKQFGVDAERVPAMLARMKELPVEFYGFHIFCGSQNLRAEAIIEAQRNTFALARRLAEDAPGPVRLLNLGGGFGIPYFPGEQVLDLAAVGAHLHGLMPQARQDFPEAEFVIELGRYIVGEAGVYVSRVIERKESRGQIFLITDGGLHHHLAASGNFGQVIRKNYPALVGNRVSPEGDATLATVVGPLCTPLDTLADKMPLGHAQEGDLIVVMQSGAYGLTASPAAFLSHPAARELLV